MRVEIKIDEINEADIVKCSPDELADCIVELINSSKFCGEEILALLQRVVGLLGIDECCSDFIYTDAYKKGHNDGYYKGREAGYCAGYNAGLKNGRLNGGLTS